MKKALDPGGYDTNTEYHFVDSAAGGDGRLILQDHGMCVIFYSEIVPFPFSEISNVQYTYATRALSFFHDKSFHHFSFAEGFTPTQLLQYLKRLVRRANKPSNKYDFSPLKPVVDDGYCLGMPAQSSDHAEGRTAYFVDYLHRALESEGFSLADDVRARLLYSVKKELQLRIEMLDILADVATRLTLAISPMQETIYKLAQALTASCAEKDEPDKEWRAQIKE